MSSISSISRNSNSNSSGGSSSSSNSGSSGSSGSSSSRRRCSNSSRKHQDHFVPEDASDSCAGKAWGRDSSVDVVMTKKRSRVARS